MHRTSLFASTSVKPLDISVQPREQERPLTRIELQIQLQDCARRKDWSALQNILTAYPDTYQPESLGEPHPVLELDLADTRELGDLAEHLPPDARLPVFVVRGADLRAPDQRIAQLTAHRHSYGLRLENCTVECDVIELFAKGARQGQEAGHTGLRELGWTNDRLPSVNQLFARDLDHQTFERHVAQCKAGESNLDELIAQSPQLEAFSLSGLIPIPTDTTDTGSNKAYGLLSLDNLLEALSKTPLKLLHLDNISRDCFRYDGGSAKGLDAWAASKTIGLQMLHLSRWNMGQAHEDPKVNRGELELLGASGLVRSEHGPIQLQCVELNDCDRLAEALGRTLTKRNTRTSVAWTMDGSGTDHGWDLFSRRLMVGEPPLAGGLKAPLALELRRPNGEDLNCLATNLMRFGMLTSLRVDGVAATDDSGSTSDRGPDVSALKMDTLLTQLGDQPNLTRLELDDVLTLLATTLPLHIAEQVAELRRAEEWQNRALHRTGKRNPALAMEYRSSLDQLRSLVDEDKAKHAAKTRQQAEWYAQLCGQVRQTRLERTGQRFVAYGFDLGHSHRLDRDVAAVIARQLDRHPGELGESLLSVALTHQANQAAWAAASREV